MARFRDRQGHLLAPALACVALLGVFALLAGCGGSDDGESTAPATGSSGASTEEPGAAAESDASDEGAEAGFEATPVDVEALPLGDDMFTTDEPRRGYVYSCITNFRGGGAFEQGPWIDPATGTWNLNEKIYVQGEVEWESEFSEEVDGADRNLVGNGLPPQPSGIFPVEADDPAYEFDRNPNTIDAYRLEAILPAEPTMASEPSCVGGTVGLMRNGVPLFSPFDAGGRDAVATEIQDTCNAHPEKTGQYHYHGLSGCLYGTDDESRSVLLGWALDGFGIYVERDADGTMLSSADLDVCHGRTSTVEWNGEQREMYHYVLTLDFPYTVACYRGEPITEANGINLGDPGAPLPEGETEIPGG